MSQGGWRALLVVVALGGGPLAQAETLRVLAWPGYADKDIVEAFERRHGVDVEITLVSSDDRLRENAANNGGRDYDVLAANTVELADFAERGLIVPLDTTLIPNTTKQLPRFRNLDNIPGTLRRGKVMAIPYTYSEMGIIYDRRQVKTPPDSVTALWDPHFEGKVLIYDGGAHNFSLAALSLGMEQPFNIQDEQWTAVHNRLIALRRNIFTFYTEPEESVELFREGEVALLFANYGTQQVTMLRDSGADIGYVIPREGALSWLDCWAMMRESPRPALAHAWINYLLEPGPARALSERQGLRNTVDAPDTEETPGARLVWLQQVENPLRRQKDWESIRTGDLPDSEP